MRRHGILLAGALALGACASNGDTSTTRPTSGGIATTITETSVVETAATATSATGTSLTQSSVEAAPVVPTSSPEPAVPVTSLTATSITESSLAGTTSDSIGPEAADRSFGVYVPTSYDGSTAIPLIVLLHGFTSNGELQESYFEMQPVAEERSFLYVHPNGTIDGRGNTFWNATDGCCNFFGSTVDDSAYLASLIEQVQARYRVDPRRIYFIGHSNGGFMSYRMACDHADTVAAIVSLAGAADADVGGCAPTQPVSVLQIHGTADTVIRYDGGRYLGPYPSAPTSVQTWADYDGCGSAASSSEPQHDVDRNIEGNEATVTAFSDCPPGIDVQLWTVPDGSHTPALSSTFITDAVDFLYAHPKP